jgi:hypothetical protein
MVWLIGLVLLVASLAVAGAGLRAFGARRWAADTRALTGPLEAGRQPLHPERYDPCELEGLPEPVQRYFRAVLTPGQPMVAAATVEHTGTFNMGTVPTAPPQWKAFKSRQRVVTRRPGFLWNARMNMAPGLPVQVHDAYIQGQGLLHAALFGLFSVARLEGAGTSEIARGEFMRFFAEAAWYPTALLPSQGVRWEAVGGDGDDGTTSARSARATLADGPLSVSLLFRFDEAGRVETVRAEARGRLVDGAVQMAPWEGRWFSYQQRDGMTVPLSGEVAWLLPEGRLPYWRGTITSLVYAW